MVTGKIRLSWILAIPFILTALVYLRALKGGFVLDDRTFFLENDILPNLKPWDLKEIFLYPSNYWNQHLPVRDFLLVVQYYFFGESTYGYHAVSLLLYLAVGYVLCLFLSELYADSIKNVQGNTFGVDMSVLVVISLFLLHPVHVESVAYITGQKDLLYSLFSFLAMYLLFKACRHNKRYFLPALLFYYMSFLSRYFALSTAIFIPALWLLMLRKKEKSIIKASAIWIGVNIPVLMWMLYGVHLGESIWFIPTTTPVVYRILGGVRILGAHTALALIPHPLSFGYPFEQGWALDINFFVGTAVLMTLLLMMILRPRSLAATSLLLYVVYLLIPLRIFKEVIPNAVIYDRYLFVPLLGMCIFFERGLTLSINRWQNLRRPFVFLFVSFLILLSSLTNAYIPKFWSDVAMTEHSYKNFPGWNRAAFEYAYSLVEAGMLDDAMELTEKEKTFSRPEWVRDYFRGWIYLERGEVDKAVEFLLRASYIGRVGGYYPYADVHLGRALALQGNHEWAEDVLKNVLSRGIGWPLEYYKAKQLLGEVSQGNGK
jgi:hypothetical protein